MKPISPTTIAKIEKVCDETLNYLRRRIVTYVAVFAVMLNLDFILPRIAPGNAVDALISGFSNPGVQRAILTNRFGLNQPILTQYYHYLQNVLTRFPPNFGFSFQFYPTSVSVLIETRLWWTIGLILVSLGLAFVIAYLMTVLSVIHRAGKTESSLAASAIFLHSTPAFFTGLLILWIFAMNLHWFPVFGKVSVGLQSSSYVASVLWHAVLPVIVLTGSILGEYYLLLRGSVQEVIKADYVSAASLRGLSGFMVTTRYIMRNSLLPLVSVISFHFAGLISRAVVVEAVFGYAGIGDLIVDATLSRDYPVLEGSLFVLTVVVILGGLIGDLIMTRLDPRLR